MHTRIIRLSVLCLSLIGVAAWSPGQTPATRQVMREKLQYTQRILEAVMKSDFMLLEQSSEALSRMPEKPGWMVLNTPEYIRYSGAFVNATQELLQSAKDHDLDAAAVHYASMAMTCYQCHRYVKNSRIAAIAPIAEQRPQGRADAKPPAQPRAEQRPQAPQGRPQGPDRRPQTRDRRAPRGARPEIYHFPLLQQPDFVYRFPNDLYFTYRFGYPYPTYGYPIPPWWLDDQVESYGGVEFDLAQKHAAVFVDGFYTGEVDDFDDGERVDLAPGTHRIELRAAEFEPAMFEVEVRPGRTIVYRTPLRPAS